MTERERQLARAYGYPYPPAEDDRADSVPPRLPTGRAAILAFGANASRAVLSAKLGPVATDVLVLDVVVGGVDAVYSAHVSPYGSIPATVHPSPGTLLFARLLFIEPGFVAALDATEPNYAREHLGVEVPGHGPVDAQIYRSRHGALHLHGSPVAVAAVRAQGRVLGARDQRDVHRALRDLIDPDEDLESFTLAAIRDPAVRARRTVRLRARCAGSPSSDRPVRLGT